jgi:hypothetical protein
MELNVGLDASFDNMKDWKRIREKAEEVKSIEAYSLEEMMKLPVELLFFFLSFIHSFIHSY